MGENKDLKDLLAKHSKMIDLKAGVRLYDYEQKAEKIYFILSGLIRVYIKGQNREIEIQRNKNGDFVGETAFTADKYSSRAEIYLNTKALEFKVADLRKIMQKNNSFANKMINNLAQYIELLENKNKVKLPSISKIDKKIENENKIKEAISTENKQEEEFIKEAAVKIKNPSSLLS